MKNNVNIQRRKLLKFAGVSAAALATFPGLINAEMMRVGSHASLDFNPE
jgi:suppressor of ftsI